MFVKECNPTGILSRPQALSVCAGADTAWRVRSRHRSSVFATQLLRFPKEELVIIWASNDLNKRWRQTLNRELPTLILGSPR